MNQNSPKAVLTLRASPPLAARFNLLAQIVEPEGSSTPRSSPYKKRGPKPGPLFLYGGERGIRTLNHAILRLAMPPNAL